MRPGGRIVWPTKVVVLIGEPIWPEPGTGERAAGDGGDRHVPRRFVGELSEVLQGDLQNLFEEAQQRAGTPNYAGTEPGGL
jgi:hypothetical protein